MMATVPATTEAEVGGKRLVSTPSTKPRCSSCSTWPETCAVVVNSGGGGDATLGGHTRRLRPPNEVVPTALSSCELPLHDPTRFGKFWSRFEGPPNHYPNRPIMEFSGKLDGFRRLRPCKGGPMVFSRVSYTGSTS